MSELFFVGFLTFIGLISIVVSVEEGWGGSKCDGTSWNIWGCCRRTGKCALGEGHCYSDDECAEGLQCGSRNCRKDFSTDKTWWSRSNNCCFDPGNPPPTFSCNGKGNWRDIWNCCKNNGPCNKGEGTCTTDSHCADGLRCGSRNCKKDFSTTSSNWKFWMNCCYEPDPSQGSGCNGKGNWWERWGCCRKNGPCQEGEGSCRTDNDCADGLTCGKRNCRKHFSNSETRWMWWDNCCLATEEPEKTTSTTSTTTTTTTTTTSTTTTTTTKEPELKACGRKPGRIVGGVEVTPYSIPWQVAFVNRGSSYPDCGGTLISDRHVLTAAHCTSSGYWKRYDVIVGEHKVSPHSQHSTDGTRHRVCRFADHPSYDYISLDNDFSILHLEQPVEFGARVVPACLPPVSFKGDFFNGKSLTVSGWGKLTEGGTSPNVLHSVIVPGWTNTACNQRQFYDNQIMDSMLCAGQANGGIDACTGDSGGPLTYTSQGQSFVVGVVSWGQGCARENKPGVYSRVTEVLDWINGELDNTC